jgi:hypothetical protein
VDNQSRGSTRRLPQDDLEHPGILPSLTVPLMVAIESVFSNISDFDDRSDDPEFRQLFMDSIGRWSPNRLSSAGHLMGVQAA